MRHSHNKKQAGFILPIVMILAQIIMLYGVSAALANQILMKQSGDTLISRQQKQAATLILNSISSNYSITDMPCQVELTRLEEIKSYPAKWWLRYGCRIENTDYLYYVVVEPLGVDPCSLITEIQQGYADIARYYRVTIAGIDESRGSVYLLMQATMTIALNQIYQCHSIPHRVTAGLQMLRQL